MQVTFAVAATLVIAALVIALGSLVTADRSGRILQ
jgi:hypothetical protein